MITHEIISVTEKNNWQTKTNYGKKIMEIEHL